MLNIDWMYNIHYINSDNKAVISLNHAWNNWCKQKFITKSFKIYKNTIDGYKWYIISKTDKIKRYFTPNEVRDLLFEGIEKEYFNK